MRRNRSGRQDADPFHEPIIEPFLLKRVNSVTSRFKVALPVPLKATKGSRRLAARERTALPMALKLKANRPAFKCKKREIGMLSIDLRKLYPLPLRPDLLATLKEQCSAADLAD